MSKKAKRNTKKSTKKMKPQAALRYKGSIHVLIKDPDAKGNYAPLPQAAKDQYYPGLDASKPSKVGKKLNLTDFEVLKLDDAETDKDRESALKLKGKKNSSKRNQAKVIRTEKILSFFNVFSHMVNSVSGYIILFAAMMAHLVNFIPGNLPTISAIYCGHALILPPILRAILCAINGLEEIIGSFYTIQRPSVLVPKRDAPTSNGPSTSPYIYFGGKLDARYLGERRFWIPLCNCAVAITAKVPENIKNYIINDMPSVIPIYCDRANDSGRSNDKNGIAVDLSDLEFDDDATIKVDDDIIIIINALFEGFLHQIRKKPKYGRYIFVRLSEFLPKRYASGGVITPTLERFFFAEGLCVYAAFLDYIADHNYLDSDTCRTIFEAAYNAVLPPSTDPTPTRVGSVIHDWDHKGTFMSFLTDYLKSNTDYIRADGTPCDFDTIAAAHTLKNSNIPLLVLPRSPLAKAYREWLRGYGVDTGWTDAELTNVSYSWGINGLKDGGKRKGKDFREAWSHQFYQENSLPGWTDKGKVICFGIPLEALPTEIMDVLNPILYNNDKPNTDEEVAHHG